MKKVTQKYEKQILLKYFTFHKTLKHEIIHDLNWV